MGRGRGHVRRPGTGSDGPAPISLPFHKQETVPGQRAAVSRGPAPPGAVGRGASARWKHRGQQPQRVHGVRALHNRGGREKVSRPNKEPEGGDSGAPPLPGARLQQPLSLESSPRAFPIRFGSAHSGYIRMTKTPVRASKGVARPTQGGTDQGPDNTRPTPDAPTPQLCGDPGLSIQEAPPQRNTRDKMRGQKMVWSLLDSPPSPPASPQIQAPTPPGAGADGWALCCNPNPKS